jgi:uroporphyrinogen decarboxylase
MMSRMTTKERFERMYQHKEADRIPFMDYPWSGTIRRWIKEGMPADVDYRDYFDIDKTAAISVDISPQFEEKIIEETDRYIIRTTPWGVTLKNFKEEDSTPEFIDYKVTSPDEWEKAKKRMTTDKSRINWDYLKKNYPKWVSEGQWISAGFWFGFDVTHSWMVGTETLLIALLEEPDWVMDMINTYLESCMAHFDMIWEAGYRFHEIYWPDDMGYKGSPFFSNDIYRRLIKPFHKKAVEWAHNKGIYARLHSCGNIMRLLPDIMDTGIDALNPIEIKAGMDPFYIKEKYGGRLVLHGAINAVLWDDKDKVIAEIERTVPMLKEKGGYIFASDHSIPNSVSLENFRAVVETVKRAGAY